MASRVTSPDVALTCVPNLAELIVMLRMEIGCQRRDLIHGFRENIFAMVCRVIPVGRVSGEKGKCFVKKLGGHRSKPDAAHRHRSAEETVRRHGSVPTPTSILRIEILSVS